MHETGICARLPVYAREFDVVDHWRQPKASPASGAQNYTKLFVAHKMTRNNTPNNIHVAATALPVIDFESCLSNTGCTGPKTNLQARWTMPLPGIDGLSKPPTSLLKLRSSKRRCVAMCRSA